MLKFKALMALAALFAITVLSLPSMAIDPVEQTVEVTADIPQVITLDIAEAEDGIELSPIYPGPGIREGSLSILSTGPCILTAKDGATGGDGRMRTSDGHVLDKIHQIRAGGNYVNLAGNSGFNLLRILAPGFYTYTTGYRQAFTAGDYAGTDYSIVVQWECSATFE